MTLPKLKSDRFSTDHGYRITVQVPEPHAQEIVDAIREKDDLKYGDYDSVTFRTASGVQQFRSMGSGRNIAMPNAVEVPCVELSFFLRSDESTVLQVLQAIYGAHPYEEPVVFVEACLRTLHIRGLDENNPNRFWNRKTEDWVPHAHR